VIDWSDLYPLYWEQHYTTGQIAEIKGVKRQSVDWAMKARGIPLRTKSEAARLAFQLGRGHYGSPYGEKNPQWKGGRKTTEDGYVYLLMPNHPRANKSRYVLEHLLVWEQVHNKPLPKDWVIHHLNGIKSDNRPENLIAMKRGEHTQQSVPFKKRIRELEAKIKLLERALDNQQLILWSEN